MNRFHVQSKVVDIHESLNVENLTDVHAENFFLQKIRKVNWKGFFKDLTAYRKNRYESIFACYQFTLIFSNWNNIDFFHKFGKIPVSMQSL